MASVEESDKPVLRARIRQQRRDLVAAGDTSAPMLLRAATTAGLLHPHSRPGAVGVLTIAAYVAAPGEPDPAAIRDAVRAAGGRVLLPIPRRGRVLDWALDDGHYTQVSRLRVPAPTGAPLGAGAACLRAAGVSLVLVPALAVDRTGMRLGQGGGFYDVLLGELTRATEGSCGPTVLAVVRSTELLAAGAIPAGPHDQRVPGALTPDGVVWFGADPEETPGPG